MKQIMIINVNPDLNHVYNVLTPPKKECRNIKGQKNNILIPKSARSHSQWSEA